MVRDGDVGVSGRVGCAGGFGLTDGELGELAVIVHDLAAAQAAVAAAEAARVRALSRAHALAGRAAAGQPVAVVARDMVLRGIAAEVAGILRVSDRWAQRQIVDAADLVGSYPGVVDAWEDGVVTRSHVSVITELGSPLPVEARAVFSDTAVAVCGREVPGRARARLAMVAERLHPRSFAERHEQARESRCVKVTDIGEGMAELMATLPSVLAHAVYDRLTAQGRAVDDARIGARKAQHAALRASTRSGVPGPAGATEASGVPGAAGAGGVSSEAVLGRVIPSDVVESDRRSMDQIRADILTDMLLTGDPCADPTREGDRPGVLGAIRARVQVTVPALTVLGADEGPAALAGHAPIDPATARRLLGTTIHPWERLLTHPVTGSVVEVDTYQRPASLDRFLRARDQHCRFPGCRLAAIRCDIDHTTDWAHGGTTHRTNLAHLCRRHHSMKHATPWRVTQHHDGVLHWTSPLGHTYTDIPEPPIAFTPDHEPGEPQHRERGPGGGRPPGNARGPGSRPASESGHPSGSAHDPREHPFGHAPLGHVDALWAMRYADAPF